MRGSKKKKKYFYIGAIILLVFFHYAGWFTFAEEGVVFLTRPVVSTARFWSLSLEEKYQKFKRRQDLEKLYAESLEKNTELNSKLAEFSSVKDENEELRKLLNFKQKMGLEFVTANVIGKNNDGLEKMILINAGSRNGLKNGEAVINGEGILIGKVASTNRQTAMVRLLSDSQSKVAGTVLNREKSLGVIEGGYGLSIRMKFIPRNEVIVVGDQVITSGLEEGFPKGLLIGEIEAVENEAYQPFQQAVLTPAVDLEKLTVVSVLLPISQNPDTDNQNR